MNAPTPTTFVDAVRSGFRNWRNTTGTATRRDFWFWFLFTVLVSMVVSTLDSIIFPVTDFEIPADTAEITGAQIRELVDLAIQQTVWSLSSLVAVLLFVPTLTVTIRRFRDAGVAPALAWGIQLLSPVTSVVLFFLVYSMVDLVDVLSSDALSSDAAVSTLGALFIALIAILVVNLVALVMWVVVAVRPSRTDGTF